MKQELYISTINTVNSDKIILKNHNAHDLLRTRACQLLIITRRDFCPYTSNPAGSPDNFEISFSLLSRGPAASLDQRLTAPSDGHSGNSRRARRHQTELTAQTKT